VTGSVAAYRAADVCRELMRNGFEIRTCLTRSAERFVTAALFEALTGNPALTDVFDEPVAGRMAHIDWARQASCLLVCPATANAIARLACGEAEDMFSTIVSASDAPIVVAPAMNPQMYASAANIENLEKLKSRGCVIIEPDEGDVACGEQGQGKLATVDRIVATVSEAALRSNLLQGKKIVITAGPTQEPLDPVRFLSNRSSGKMGFALARAALQMGADVSVVSGPCHEVGHPRAKTIKVQTAQEMLDETIKLCASADLLIGAAAVADFRPKNYNETKSKDKKAFNLELVPNADILATARIQYPKLAIVGFAAETHDHEALAHEKLSKKQLQAIALNDVSRTDIGMDSENNEVHLVFADGYSRLIGKSSKLNLAFQMLQALAERVLA
jgi:phosphopantothenoylcysteine decarboxylase/phosphopantothenate--cysteine ligase